MTTLQLPDQDTGDAFLAELRASRRARLIVISGPSGVGKDSVIDQLRPVLPDVHFAVTATTRPRRPNEIEGVHYYFLGRDEFLARQADGEFLESAVVYDNLYGVPRTPIRRAIERGQDVVVKVDVQGSATIRALSPDGTFIFLAPESMPELYRRLSGRKTDDPDAVMRRFNEASRELLRANEFDYLVFNEAARMESAIDEIVAIVTAERLKTAQQPVRI